LKRQLLLGAMFGTMAGMAVAMAVHTLLSAHPELAAGGLGQALAALSAPGARLIAMLGARAGMNGLGALAHWLSLQLTLVGLGALIGLLAGFIAQARRPRTPDSPPAG
jgi:hypothetical protein